MPESPSLSKKPKLMVRHEVVASWASTAAAVVAAVGLIFTGCSVKYQGNQTRYQADQTKLQTEAARRQADDEDKTQAKLINLWPSAAFSSKTMFVTVTNRSQEPVYRFRLYIAYAASPTDRYLLIRTWDSFQPCTRVSFDLLAIARSFRRATALNTTNTHRSPFDYGIMFVDASGKAWHRHAAGTLHLNPWLEYLDDGSRTPRVPPVFRQGGYTPQESAAYTIPQPRQQFVKAGPEKAEGCEAD
jgi:hypothetical protein